MSLYTALTIGFDHQELLVLEGSVATVQINVLSGSLLKSITVQFTTEDITAIRKSYTVIALPYTCRVGYFLI